MTRTETIIELLKWYPEAVAGGGGGLSDWIGTGHDSKLLTYGPLYHANCPRDCDGGVRCRSPFQELTRCLGMLREFRPKQYAHLSARFYGGIETRRQVRFVKRGRDIEAIGLTTHQEIRVQGGATSSKLVLDCLVYSWPAWVRQHKVDLAVEYLAGRFQGVPFLPVAVLAA